MRRRLLFPGLVLLLLAGCQSGPKKNLYENDPLVLSNKPVDGIINPKPLPVARAEPVPPQLPAPPDAVVGNSGVAALPTATLKKPVGAIPAVRLTTIQPITTPVYAHADDLSWLQGVVEKHYQGYLELRFAEATLDDHWGGKVRLDDDPRLSALVDGDVVRVEGWLVPGENGVKKSWNEPRRYKVNTIRLVRRVG